MQHANKEALKEDSQDPVIASMANEESQSPGKQPSFPERLMSILSNESLSDIITWLPNGKRWRVIDTVRFEREVIPNYFGKANSKYSSFKRRLNRWEFLRVSSGIEKGAYYHPLFRRDDKTMCVHMKFFRHHKEPLHPSALAIATPKIAEFGMASSMAAARNALAGDGYAGQLQIPIVNAPKGQAAEPGSRALHEPRHLPNPLTSSHDVSQGLPSQAPIMAPQLLHQHLEFLKMRQGLHICQDEVAETPQMDDYQQMPSISSRLRSNPDGTIYGLSNVGPEELSVLLAHQMNETQNWRQSPLQQHPLQAIDKILPQEGDNFCRSAAASELSSSRLLEFPSNRMRTSGEEGKEHAELSTHGTNIESIPSPTLMTSHPDASDASFTTSLFDSSSGDESETSTTGHNEEEEQKDLTLPFTPINTGTIKNDSKKIVPTRPYEGRSPAMPLVVASDASITSSLFESSTDDKSGSSPPNHEDEGDRKVSALPSLTTRQSPYYRRPGERTIVAEDGTQTSLRQEESRRSPLLVRTKGEPPSPSSPPPPLQAPHPPRGDDES